MTQLRPILLAEDNPYDVELVLTAFEQARLLNEVVVASDGEEALDYLYRRGKFADRVWIPPAVVLLDLKMPRVDGREVLRQIRGDAELCRTPVVVLTSSKEERDLYQSYDLGANGYVVKPVGFEDFIGAVAKLGVFWAVLNEPPPAGASPWREANALPSEPV